MGTLERMRWIWIGLALSLAGSARGAPADPYGAAGPLVAIAAGDALRFVRAAPDGIVTVHEDPQARALQMGWVDASRFVVITAAGEVRVYARSPRFDGRPVRTIPFDPSWGFGTPLDDTLKTSTGAQLELVETPDGKLWLAGATIVAVDDESEPAELAWRVVLLDGVVRVLTAMPRRARPAWDAPARVPRRGVGVRVELVRGARSDEWKTRYRDVFITCSAPLAPAPRHALALASNGLDFDWRPASVEWLNADPPRFRIEHEPDDSGLSEDFVFRDCGERLHDITPVAEGVFAERVSQGSAWDLWVAGVKRASIVGDVLAIEPPPAPAATR